MFFVIYIAFHSVYGSSFACSWVAWHTAYHLHHITYPPHITTFHRIPQTYSPILSWPDRLIWIVKITRNQFRIIPLLNGAYRNSMDWCMQEPVACACQLFIFCKDDVARCVPAGDNDARPDHLVNKCNLPPCLRGWVRSISTTKLVVNEQLKPVEIIDWSMIPCTRGQGTCTYGGVGCGHTPSIVPIRTPIIGARQTGADRQSYWVPSYQGVPCFWLFGDMSRLISRFLRDSQPTMKISAARHREISALCARGSPPWRSGGLMNDDQVYKLL